MLFFNQLLTCPFLSGFDSARLRQIMIRDIRNFNTPIKTLELDCSTGVLMPLYDADTNMLFLVGKGDTTILYMEVIDREPFLIEGLRHTGELEFGFIVGVFDKRDDWKDLEIKYFFSYRMDLGMSSEI